MHTHSRFAFTIVEALVALAVVGIASAALAVSLAASGSLRRRATARLATGQALGARLAMLAARPCTAADTNGVVTAGGITEWWTARRVGAGWAFTDSIGSSTAMETRTSGAVSCAP